MSDATDRGRALTDLLAEAEGADEVRQAEIADLLRAEAGLADLTGEDALRAARLIHRSASRPICPSPAASPSGPTTTGSPGRDGCSPSART